MSSVEAMTMEEIWTMAKAKKAHSQHRADGGHLSFRLYARTYFHGYNTEGKLRRIVGK